METLLAVLQHQRWFFVRMSGRRRIGKTALVGEALRRSGRERVAFVQVDDAEPAAVVATARRHLALTGVPDALLPVDLITLAARCVAERAGYLPLDLNDLTEGLHE